MANKTQEELIVSAANKIITAVGAEHASLLQQAIREIVEAAQTYTVYGVETQRFNQGLDNEE